MRLFINKIPKCLAIFVVVCLLVISFHQESLATTSDASNFVNDLAERVISIVKRKDLSEKDKERKLHDIFVKSIDTQWIGKFAMGKYWRGLNPKQQSSYLDLYSEYLTGLYVPNFRKYTGNVVKILASQEVRPKEYLVQTELTDPLNSLNIKINYRLMQKDSGFENFIIFDVIAEGVSLITAQRAEINSVMENGNFNKLMDLLRKKTASSTK